MNAMDQQQTLFDERVTMSKIQEYRSQVDDGSSGNHSTGTYEEMVEEVERVSEMLMRTQSKLWQSQDELKTYNSKAKILQTSLEQREHENKKLREENDELYQQESILRHEVERLKRELLDRDEGRARPELERRLRKAIDFLKKDLNATNEKYSQAKEEIHAHQKTIGDLQKVNKVLEERSIERQCKAQCSDELLATIQKQLRQASEENATLLEEVARLREELCRTKKIAEQKDVLIRREVEDSVKEKIKLEVTKSVSKQVTERVTREVTSRMKAERDKELNSLREQIRKIVKENSFLQSKIDGAERMASEADALQQDVHVLTYEISRYEAMVAEAKQEYELRLSRLETDHRLKIQTVKDEAAKEKWAHVSEIRQQMAAEREREVESFTQRIEALSRQAERILDRAEKEKEEYGKLIRKRAEEEWEREVKALSEKLDARKKEKDQILRDARSESAAYFEQDRRAMEDEKRKEISKYTSRIEVLVEENDGCKKRIESLEEELRVAWEENRNHEEQHKRVQSNLKHVEDENFKLKRKTQNFSTLMNRYKQDAEESMKELREAKQLFRDALLKSEGQNLKLKTKLKKLESSSRNEQQRENVDRTNALVDQVYLYDRDKSHSKVSDKKAVVTGSGSNMASNDWWIPIKSENARLQRSIASLESLLRDARKEDYAASDELLLAMEAGSVQLQSSITGMDSLFRKYRHEFMQSARIDNIQIDSLKDQLKTTERLLKEYRLHQLDTARELERARQMTEDALTLASEDDTVQLKHEIQTIERMLKMLKHVGQSTMGLHSDAGARHSERHNVDNLERLQGELDSLTSTLEKAAQDLASKDENDEIAKEYGSNDSRMVKKLQSDIVELTDVNLQLESRIESLNYVLEKYRGELSKASHDLEHTRQTLALEGEAAQKLSRRVESLNLLLDTTEQNHAENVRELAQSRLLLQEAAHASKREIEKLKAEITQLNLMLDEKEQQFQIRHQQAEQQRQEYEMRLEEASRLTTEWKHKFEQNVQKNECDQLQAEEEGERSKQMHQEMIERAEREINDQHKVIESLRKPKIDHENTMNELKKALRLSERGKEEELKRMEDVLRQARDESKFLLKKMEESEKTFLRALQESEEEKNSLKKSLEDVKKTLLGQSYDESSNDNSSRRCNRSLAILATEAETSLDVLEHNVAQSSDSDDLPVEFFARLDNFIVSKKKRVTWKDSEWDLDMSTVATAASHASRQEVPDAAVLNVEFVQAPKGDDHASYEQEIMSEGMSTIISPSPCLVDIDEATATSTLEQIVGWKRNKSPCPSRGTSWDDSTCTPPGSLEKYDDTSCGPTKSARRSDRDYRIRNGLARDTLRPSRSPYDDPPRNQKVVSWNLETVESTGDLSPKPKESGDRDVPWPSLNRAVESREPTLDNAPGTLGTSMIDYREDMSGKEIEDFGEMGEMTDQTDDDESSTIDWNILQPADNTGTESVASTILETTVREGPFLPSSAHRNFPLGSLSSSFSYSSNGSSADCDIVEREVLLDSEDLEPNSAIPMKSSVNIKHSSGPLYQRQSKSGCQRAREKALRNNWTKDKLNKFISRKKTGRTERMKRPSEVRDRTCDEGAYSSGSQGKESRDTNETLEMEAATIFSEE